jgi:hypothetical protein
MRTLGLVALLLGSVSCVSPGNWSYSAEAPKTRQPHINKTVGVYLATDRRTDENEVARIIGSIPLMPYGWTELARPETTTAHMVMNTEWRFAPTTDISKAVAAELQSSGLFKEAFLAERPNDGDLQMQVTIISTDYETKNFTYCLSIAGPFLWLIGFPAGSFTNKLSLMFELKDQAGTLLWSGEGHRNFESGAVWIYKVPSDFRYDNMLKEIMMDEVLPALEKLPAQA